MIGCGCCGVGVAVASNPVGYADAVGVAVSALSTPPDEDAAATVAVATEADCAVDAIEDVHALRIKATSARRLPSMCR